MTQDRHVYTNGILLANRLRNLSKEITVNNSLTNLDELLGLDLIIISTNYVSIGWDRHLIELLGYLNKYNIKSIVGGIGIKRLSTSNVSSFQLIKSLINGYIIISDNGLSILKWAIENLFDIKNKILQVEDGYEIMANDFSLDGLNLDLHSKHSTFLTQTGCPFNCSFCSYKNKYKKHTLFNFDSIKESLSGMLKTNKRGLRHIRFVDETFNVDVLRAMDICKYIISQQYKFNWSCFLRAEKITPELAFLLAKAGCNLVSIGIESGSRYMQKIMNKNLNLIKIKRLFYC